MFFALWNAAAVGSCRCRGYFYFSFFPEPRRTSPDWVLSTFVWSFTSSVCRITTAASVLLLHPPPPFSSRSTALDAALEFQQQFVVPSTWKTEVKEESSSSEDDDEDEDEEQEEDASGEEEEVEASLTASQLRKCL